jgi:hypothetical protein
MCVTQPKGDPVIRFTIDATLTALPRPSQLTIETVNEGTRRALQNPKLDPGMRAYYEQVLAEPRLQIGRYSNGTEFTMLRMEHEGRRLEISATERLAHKAVAQMQVGESYRISVELLGEEPHYRMRLRSFR